MTSILDRPFPLDRIGSNMALPDANMLLTLSDDTGNVEVKSNLKADAGTITRVDADEPIAFVADDGIIIPSRTTTERDAITSPPDASVIFNSTDNELQIFHSSQWNGSAYGNMFFRDNVTVTTINTVDVFEDVLNFGAGELKETTFASDTLTTGNITATYSIGYAVCIIDSTNTTYETAIEIDGTIRDESLSCTTIPTGGNPDSLGGTFILTVGALKDIKLVIRNVSNTANVTVIHASVVITRIR